MNKKELQIYIKESQGSLLTAQEACKVAIFRTSYKLKELHDLFKEKGFIENYNIEVGIWNSGYDLKVNIRKINYHKIPTTSSFMWNVIYNQSRIYIQPEIFYENRFLKGKAHIEAKLVVADKDQVNYKSYLVAKTRAEGNDLDDVCNGITDVNNVRIHDLINQIK